MDQKEWYERWKREEEIAHIKGWDFSHIHGKYEEEDELPWDFRSLIQAHLRKEMRLLDMDDQYIEYHKGIFVNFLKRIFTDPLKRFSRSESDDIMRTHLHWSH